MHKVLNLQCLYKVSIEEEHLIYSFTTANGVTYKVAFEQVDYLEIDNLYSISVGCEVKNPPFDLQTQKTIQEIIKHFFNDTQRSIIYLCSFEDEKADIRFKKFHRWFCNDIFSEHLTKIDGIIYSEIDYFSSLIVHNKNLQKKHLQKTYLQMVHNLNHK